MALVGVRTPSATVSHPSRLRESLVAVVVGGGGNKRSPQQRKCERGRAAVGVWLSARSGSCRRIVYIPHLLSSRALGSGLAPTIVFVLPLVVGQCRFAVRAVLLVLGALRLIPLLTTAAQRSSLWRKYLN